MKAKNKDFTDKNAVPPISLCCGYPIRRNPVRIQPLHSDVCVKSNAVCEAIDIHGMCGFMSSNLQIARVSTPIIAFWFSHTLLTRQACIKEP